MRRASLGLLGFVLPASGALLGVAEARADQPTTSAPDGLTPRLSTPTSASTPPAPGSSGERRRARAPREGVLYPGYSRYESAAIERALSLLDASLDPAPEGKIVEAVDVVPFEVIEDRDPAPGFLNWFHATSRPEVIRREVLLALRQPYAQALADETARNLRALNQLSLVLVLAVRGSSPDRVRVAVVTKDVWSLRLNSNYRIAGGQIEHLFLQPSEENLFGTHHAIAAQLSLDPGSLSLGAGYSMPRVGNSHVLMSTELNAILGRKTGDLEGSFGSFAYGQPLYATEAEWAWVAKIGWRNEVTRRFIGLSPVLFDAAATPDVDDQIPFQYRSDLLVGSYIVTRSFGGPGARRGAEPSGWRGTKHDISIGIEASRKVYRVGDLSAFAPTAVAEFQRTQLPVSDTRIGPTFKYHTYSTRFSRVLDVNTLALQEDYRSGHDLAIKLYPVTTALGSSRDFLGVSVAAAYTVPLGDGLARAVVESVTEIERSRLPDASIDISARVHTPSFGVGRLVFDVEVLDRYRNYLNRRTRIGGETRLRGYPTEAFIGEDVLVANLEFRSRPAEIWSCQLAGAAFFDTGDAFDRFDEMRLKQSAGFGLRLLFPQLERVVMRADWGFPLTRGYKEPDSFPGDIIVTFEQAFPMPSPLTDP